MLLPGIFNDRLFDDFMDFPEFPEMRGVDKRLYGKNAPHVMKTDVKEHDDCFTAEVDLPGFKKDQILLRLENGYLTVRAAKGIDKEEKNKKGKIIRQERYSGTMERSFYVGDEMTEEDIKAKFEDGVLTLTIPKKEPKPPVTAKKYISIE